MHRAGSQPLPVSSCGPCVCLCPNLLLQGPRSDGTRPPGDLILPDYLLKNILSPIQSRSEVLGGVSFPHMDLGGTVQPITDGSLRTRSCAGRSVRMLVGGGKSAGLLCPFPSLVPSPSAQPTSFPSGLVLTGDGVTPLGPSSEGICPACDPHGRQTGQAVPGFLGHSSPAPRPRRSCWQRPLWPCFPGCLRPRHTGFGGAGQPC